MYLLTVVLLLAAALVAEPQPLLGLYAHRPPPPPQSQRQTPGGSAPPPPPPLPSTDQEAAVGGCRCPATLQYDPVCGTDNQTYNSMQLLICAQRCGRDVQVSFKGRCSPLAG